MVRARSVVTLSRAMWVPLKTVGKSRMRLGARARPDHGDVEQAVGVKRVGADQHSAP